MPKDTNIIETSTANKVFDIPVKLEPGQVNTLSFDQDSISGMRQTPQGELEISFRDGSKVTIENFDELVNSAQSCGRDTLIQLSDNTIIYPEELAAKLAQGPVNFEAATDASGAILLSAPKAGQTENANIEAGREYKFGFSLADTVSAAQAGQNLILTFKDGGVLVLKNYYTSMNSELPPAMTLADGSVIDANALLTSCKLVEIPAIAETVADAVPAQPKVAVIEPAAGEEEAAAEKQAAMTKPKKMAAPDIEPAAGDEANVANIEPAAGDAGNRPASSSRGYGFGSSIDAAGLNGANPVGPIGATNLNYGADFRRSDLRPGVPTTSTPVDSKPVVLGAENIVDETNLGPNVVTGNVGASFGNDGPGLVAFNPTFTSGGSQLGGALTSNGVPVVVSLSGNTYTGVAGGVTIFTLTINPATGAYTFTQFGQLDHADGTNPNDAITLNFGITAIDQDGDTTDSSISITVLDDAPVAVDDGATVGSAPLTVTGNVTSNDDGGADASAKVTQVVFNGTTYTVPAVGTVSITGVYGTLVIGADGAYTYTSSNTAEGTDVFTYTLVDYDGDASTANLSVTVSDIDTIPTVTPGVGQVDETDLGPNVVSGTVGADFKDDGPGTFAFGGFSSGGSQLGGALTSGGVPVVVSLSGNTYTGVAGGVTVFTLTLNPATGAYTFTQFAALDHADANNPNDVINLQFGVNITDTDGDTVPTTITIDVLDDQPVAVADTNTVAPGTTEVTGNVLANDDANNDGGAHVTSVTFNGTTYTVPAVGTISIIGTYGTLVIGANGAYTYTSNNSAEGTDVFSYTMKDFDGDPSTSTLTLTVSDIDTVPKVTPGIGAVDETDLTPTSISGTLTVDFGDDGPGTFAFGGFSSGGSQLGGALTSGGVPVTVTLVGNTYTGVAGGQVVFTLTLDPATGAYTFNQLKQLDHADPTNTNDAISLQFGVNVTDADGDTVPTTITINVLDDAPVAVNDTNAVAPGTTEVTGNVLTNDDANNDGGAHVTSVTFNGTTYTVPAVGTISIIGAYGTLVIGANGAYTYTSSNTAEGSDVFTYTMKDFDGDPATATLTVTVCDVDTVPVVTPAVGQVDETNLTPTAVSGTVGANFGDDGPGTFAFGGFSSGGSQLGGELTSGGVPLTVSLSGNTYTGVAGGVTVFTLTLNPATGAYTFTQFAALDHADATNPNDVITLQFGVTATDSDGDSAPTSITISVLDDQPVAVNDTGTVPAGSNSVSGNVLVNDDANNDGGAHVTAVTFNGTTYAVPAVGTISIVGTYGTLVIGTNGAYTYTSSNSAAGSDVFTYTMKDFDGDPATATLTVTVSDIDTVPCVQNVTRVVDETALDDSGTQTLTGTLVVDYAADGPGTVTPTGAGSFSAGGSLAGGALTSHGVPVVVTLVGNTYTGVAGGVTIFTLQVNTNGTYTFKQFEQIDHADKTNPDDVISLNFGFTATDTDGDVANGTITVNVKDDGPVAVNDTATLGSAPGSVSGNVLSNDDAGADEPAVVTKVTFGGVTYNVPAVGVLTVTGAHGTLTIDKSGAYTYAGTSVGSDAFTYTIVDFDGDPATATLTVTVSDIDTVPCVQNVTRVVDETALDDSGTQTLTGTLVVDYAADGPGTVTPTGAGSFSAGGSLAGGALTSHGVPVVVTLVGNTYTGVAGGVTIFTLQVNTNGTYTFKQFEQIDHADKTNPDDVISLNFGFTATDTDGDVANGTITVNVKDDGPVAVNDTATLGSAPGSVSGNVLSNDDAGADEPAVVTKVTFGGVTYNVPAVGVLTVTGAHGTLTIDKSGAYTYAGTSVGSDAFTYTIVDFDGDPATATLTVTVSDIDTVPCVQNVTRVVDETALDDSGTQTLTGTLVVDYAADGPGTVTPTGAGSFSAGGSLAGGALTSHGVPVVVTLVGNTYTGVAGGVTIFTLQVNTNGTYTFKQFEQIDHADKTNPDDVISLNFGFTATDTDGDVANGTITVNVKDDGPVAVNDTATLGSAPGSVSGNVLSNDDAGADEPAVVTKVTFGGVTYNVPAVGVLTVTGAHGTLTIDKSGAYTYAGTSVGSDAFTYTIVDFDGDPATATLTVTVSDIDTVPCVQNVTRVVDETALDDSGTQTLTGTLVVDYAADGPGTVTPTGAGSFSAGGSLAGGALTSHGVPVVVTLVGNTYTGVAGGVTIFTLQVNTNGTYTFKQFEQIDHADKTNPDDVISLNFGFTATDTDGDVANGTITVNVKDDGPVAVNDTATLGSAPGSVSGNVLSNDDAGADEPAVVTKVTFGGVTYNVPAVGVLTVTGAHGTLTIDKSGAYTYAGTSVGSDAFTYTIVDFDGDPATATLTVTVSDIDTVPCVQNVTRVVDETALDDSGTQTLTGTLVVDYAADGPGTVTPTGAGSFSAGGSLAGGALTSHGVPVVVTLVGNTYTGVAGGVTIFTLQVNTNGTYTFKQFEQIDHADKTNPDDVISLNFGFTATDTDGDVANGTITVNVKDDGPVAVNDTATLGSAPGSVSGNVLSNDDAGADEPAVVTKVTFGGVTYNVPAVGVLTVTGAHGTLTIDKSGAYTYAGTSVGSDAFTYTIVDFDGDPATATLTVTVADVDDIPCITDVNVCLDETNLVPAGQSVTGNTVPNFFSDGPGTVTPTGTAIFVAGGSMKGGVLKSDGVAVVVTLVGNTYVGMAGDRKVFEMKVNADGTFKFTQFDNLDHGDNKNTNEEITLKFGVTATDNDGDTATAKITVCIADDAPIARDDCYDMTVGQKVQTGNVLTNDTIGNDYDANVVVWATFNGTKYTIPYGGSTTVVGTYGTLVLNSNGTYTYTANDGAVGHDEFTYTICDTDQDISTAELCFEVDNANPPPPPTLCVEDICVYEDYCTTVSVATAPVGGNGNEVTTITISGFTPGWTVVTAYSGGTYNAATGTWTITVPAGQSYHGGPTIYPPHNSDHDLNLQVSATVFDPDTGMTSAAQTDGFTVFNDAIADRPDVVATDMNVVGTTVIPLNIHVALTDTDGSEVIKSISIGGVPPGMTLSAGTYDALSGKWFLTQDQLVDLKLFATPNTIGSFDLTVTAVSKEENLSGSEWYFANNEASATDILTITLNTGCGCGNDSVVNNTNIVDISYIIEETDTVTAAINDFVYVNDNKSDVIEAPISLAPEAPTNAGTLDDLAVLNQQQQNQSGFGT